MQDNTLRNKIIFYLGAALALVISFIVFFKTMAPTLSFWDCGEFVASSYILGVPHPPGTPLFILIGRFFILLGIFSTAALNTNFISVLSSAITSMMIYFIIVKVVEKYMLTKQEPGSDSLLTRLGIYAGALSGSLIMSFSSTFWFNAVESEVYGAAMMLMAIITYITLIWADNQGKPGNDKLLIAIAYLLFLSIGIHLTTFLMIPAIVVYIALVDNTKMKDWRFWVCWSILFSFALPIYIPLQIMIPVLMEWQIETWLFLMVAFAALTGYKAFTSAGKQRHAWALYFGITIAAFIGFTPHIYIPIRAAEKPAINENNPDNWPRLKAYLERKQYGQESMVTRMFPRRGKLENQFGDYPNMGFWGYFKEQYSGDWSGILRYLPFLIGLFGMYISLRKSFRNGFLLAAIFLISSLGLLMYLNFADGTKADHLEVRDRDYFYTPAFMYFAIIIGVGLSSIMGKLQSWLSKYMPQMASYVLWLVALIIVLLMPVDTLTYHYRTHDRTGDYAPWDYAYNILNSCDQDAIIFTNGDNDTFPLWYLQEVEGIRTDVRVVNLSLLNTDWYIMQLKHQMNVPITLEDDQIVWHEYDRRGQIIFYRPDKPFYDPIRGQNRYLNAYQDARTGKVVRVQDQMIEHILLANKWKYPIYFSTSVPESNRLTLNDFIVSKAMALQVMPEKPPAELDVDATTNLLYNVYKYRGVDDITVFKDNNNVGLTSTYPERFLELSQFYIQQGDSAKSRQTLYDTIDRFPIYYQTYVDLINQYKAMEMPDSAAAIYNRGVENMTRAATAWPEITLYQQFLGELNFAYRDYDEAIRHYEAAWKLDPTATITCYRLVQLYASVGATQKGFDLLEFWLNEHSDDMYARNMYNIYKRSM
jgi:tetratricopeptide (TPR) repeat protein